MANPFEGMKVLSIDDTALKFGKHKGLSPNAVAKIDAGYILWLYETIEPKVVSKALYNAVYENEMEGEAFDDDPFGVDFYFPDKDW